MWKYVNLAINTLKYINLVSNTPIILENNVNSLNHSIHPRE